MTIIILSDEVDKVSFDDDLEEILKSLVEITVYRKRENLECLINDLSHIDRIT